MTDNNSNNNNNDNNIKINNDDNNNNDNKDDNNNNDEDNNNNDNYNNDNKVYKKNINKNVRYEFNYDINNFKNHHNLKINKNEIKNVDDVFKFIKNEKKNYDLKIEEEEKKLTAIFENFNNELYKYKDERKDIIKKSYFKLNDKKYFIEENISNILSKILFLNYRLKCKLFIEIPLLKDDNSEDNLKKDSKCENKVNNNENKKEKIQKIKENITKESKNIEKKKKENDNLGNKIIQNETKKNKIDSNENLDNLNINKIKERKERLNNLRALINEKKFIYKMNNFYYYDNCEPNYLNNNFIINVNNRNVDLNIYDIATKDKKILHQDKEERKKEKERKKIILLTNIIYKKFFIDKYFNKWRNLLFEIGIKEILKKEKIKKQSIKKEEKIIPLVNPNFQLLPTIILTFDYDCKIDENLYDKLKEEISEIIDKKNFSIIEIQKGSSIAKIILINELAKNGIKASKNQQSSEEINSVIKKIENKKFVCLGNNNPSNSKYNIPDYSKENNRKELVNFLKNSKENEDILFATSTIKDEDFDKILDSSINNISNQVLMQEINQKKFVLTNLENFNN